MRLIMRVTLFITFWLLASCDMNMKPKQPNTVIFCSEKDLGVLNPQLTADASVIDTISNTMFNRLIETDAVGRAVVPSLATHWRVSSDKTQYHLFLRQDVQFHHTPYFTPTRFMTADDVVFSFQRVLNANSPFHEVSRGVYPLFDYTDVNNIQEVKALNDHEVLFILKRPYPQFLTLLAFSGAVVHSLEYAQQVLSQGRKRDLDLYPIGTGPFQYVSYQRDVSLRLKKNPYYWNADKVQLEHLLFDITATNRNRTAKLIQGDCDISASPKINDLPKVIQDGRFELQARAGMNTTFMGFNTKKPPFNNIALRKAVAYAVNKTDILKSIFYFTAQEATTLIPVTSWAYTPPEKFYAYHPDYARYLLAQQNVKSLKFDLWVDGGLNSYNPNMLKTAEIIQASLAEVGIEVSLKIFNGTVFRQELSHIHYDAFLFGWDDRQNQPEFFTVPFFLSKK